MAELLRASGIPVCLIPDAGVGYVIHKVDKVLLGAEGVAESGGVINQTGSYQVALIANHSNKPVYVAAESHKFVRLYPLSPSDIATEYPLEFSSDQSEASKDVTHSPQVDYTPHELITALITDLGTLTPSGVSEELVKIWLD